MFRSYGVDLVFVVVVVLKMFEKYNLKYKIKWRVIFVINGELNIDDEELDYIVVVFNEFKVELIVMYVFVF